MLEKKYVKYYLLGYLNYYLVSKEFSFSSESESYKQYKLRTSLALLGIKSKMIGKICPVNVMLVVEVAISWFVVSLRFLGVMAKSFFVKKREFESCLFLPGISVASFRVVEMLKSIRPMEVNTFKIPFVKSHYRENDVDVLSCISIKDIYQSFWGSLVAIFIIAHKYGYRDFLFRSYSSFEFLLTCCFVRNVEKKNKFVYYNTYERWAFLFSNAETERIFIQHGKLPAYLHIIKVGTPTKAFYISEEQKDILEKVLFYKSPQEFAYRPNLTFVGNELLKNNGKKNILLVCCMNTIEQERKIIKILSSKNVNLYVKPHPRDKNISEYKEMASKYNYSLMPKTAYPKVDTVISYDSTLADEYEKVDIEVIRYDLLDNINELDKLIS